MNKTCENCAFYHAYYRAGFYCFWDEYEGVCRKSGNASTRNDFCEIWEKRRPQQLTVELIDKAIDDVKFIIENM